MHPRIDFFLSKHETYIRVQNQIATHLSVHRSKHEANKKGSRKVFPFSKDHNKQEPGEERRSSQCIKMQAGRQAERVVETKKNLKDEMPIFPIHNLFLLRLVLLELCFHPVFRRPCGCEPIIVFHFERKT